jgi:hypothetical protein
MRTSPPWTPASVTLVSSESAEVAREASLPGVASAQAGKHRFPRWAWAAAVAAAAIVAFLCYLRLAGTFAASDDGADQALQAWDMLHGNWLLRGWVFGDVSYYTTELPEYVIVVALRGLGPSVIHVAGAVTYTLLVLLAGLVAKGRATGREGVVRALIASGIMLAPQLGNGIHLLVSQPDHLGTEVPLLVMFLMLDRASRRWYVPVAVAVILTLVLVADRIALLDAAIPLAAVCGARVLVTLIRRRGSLSSPWFESQRFEISLIGAALVSVGASTVVVSVIGRIGGFQVESLRTAASPVRALPAHFVLAMEGVLNMYGADVFGISRGNIWGPASGNLGVGVAAAIAVVHLAGVALAAWGLCRAVRRFFSASELIVPVLAGGIGVTLAAYVFSIDPGTLFDTRDILPLLPYGAVLAGRLLAGSLVRARLEPALACVLACYAVALGYGAAQPPVNDNEQPIVGWLEAHHLHTGLGTYTESNLITLDSGGRVSVSTVSWWPAGAVPRAYESKTSWYDPRLNYANFVVCNTADGGGASVIPMGDIRAFAGAPARTYHYKTFTIMIWNKNLLTDLGSPPSIKPGNIH